MGQRTPLYNEHLAANAKIVDFGGWDMPIHYGSQVEEHKQVREHAGMFDVSHMTVVDIEGPGAKAFLERLLANDVNRLKINGKALYSAMLNEEGGVIDDLIVYRNDPDYLMVVNCATREKDLAWLSLQAGSFDCTVTERPELAIIAVQGPAAMDIVGEVRPAMAETLSSLKVYQGGWVGDAWVARTGYTGEKGVEIVLPAGDAVALWQALGAAGVAAIGLGARDTLRLEAGMNLYGSDMDEDVNPFESNMGGTVVLEDRDFIGRDAMLAVADAPARELVGLIMTERGVLRSHYPVYSGETEVGEITSGAFSPSLGHSIALARVTTTDGPLTVGIRNKRMPVTHVTVPFVRNGKPTFEIAGD